jgi:hypothetical protein
VTSSPTCRRRTSSTASPTTSGRCTTRAAPPGYAPRDFLGEPGRPELVAPNQLFAWNPSARGAKSEDTVLAAPEGTRIITADADWPVAREVRGLRRLLPLPYA